MGSVRTLLPRARARSLEQYEIVIPDLVRDPDLWFVHILTPERMVGAMLLLCALVAAWNTKCDPPTRRCRRLHELRPRL